MATELTFTTRGTQDVLGAYQKMSDAQAKVAKGAGDVNEQLQLTSKEAKALDRLQQEISKRNETASERYIRKLEEARRALAGHTKETELLKRETVRLNDEYIKAAESNKKLSAEERAALSALRAETSKLKDELGLVEDATDDAFGTVAVSKIGAMASAVLMATGPLVLYKKGLEETKAAIEKAKATAEATAPGAGELRQLANSQEEYDRLEGIAKRLRLSGAVKDLPQAYQTVFSLASAEFADDDSVAMFEKFGQQQVVENIGALAESTQVYKSSYGPEEAGTAKQILAKSFAAAGDSPGTVQQVQAAIGNVGAVASGAGIPDEQVGAGIAVLAKTIGSPERADTTLTAFLMSTEEDRYYRTAVEQLKTSKAAQADAQKAIVENEKKIADLEQQLVEKRGSMSDSLRKQLDDAQRTLDRALEDQRLARTEAAKRGVGRRVDDARRKLSELEQANPDAATSTLERRIATAREKATELAASLAEQDAAVAAAQKAESFGSLTGLSIRDRVTRIQSMNLSTAELQDLLGRKEAIAAYSKLGLNLGMYDTAFAEVSNANDDTSIVDRKLAIRATLPDAELVSRQEKALIERENLIQGQAQQLLDDLWAKSRQETRRGVREGLGDNVIGNFAAEAMAGVLWTAEQVRSGAQTPLGQLANIDDPAGPLTPSAAQLELARRLAAEQKAVEAQLAEMRAQSEQMREQTRLLNQLNQKEGGMIGSNQ
jgi:hypothetical protein